MYRFLIEDDPDIRAQVEASLREFYEQGNESIHWPKDDKGFFVWIDNQLIRRLGGPDRLWAIKALGYLGRYAKAALPQLEAMYTESLDSETRKALNRSIKAIRGQSDPAKR